MRIFNELPTAETAKPDISTLEKPDITTLGLQSQIKCLSAWYIYPLKDRHFLSVATTFPA